MIIMKKMNDYGVQRVLHSESVAKNTHSRGKNQKPEKSELSMGRGTSQPTVEYR